LLKGLAPRVHRFQLGISDAKFSHPIAQMRSRSVCARATWL
jgi:hypothetical protein